MTVILENADSLRTAFAQAGQAHVFAWWDELSPAQRENLCAQAAEIDLAEIDRLVEELVRQEPEPLFDLTGLEPAPYIPHPASGGEEEPWQSAIAAGEEALRAGKVAVFVVAGGQGTRLGYDGPKGTYPVTPVKQKRLFEVFAGKLKAAEARYGKAVPWFIMTSHANHEATVRFFEENAYLGLQREDVFFFSQGRMPAVDPAGRIVMAEKGAIAMSPDGHGGSLRALVRSGAVEEMRRRGVETLSYFQVDNPLVHIADPAFIGFHRRAGAAMSSKMIPKAYPKEKVGAFCLEGDKMVVVEYSDLPDELAEARNEEGQLRFLAGSIAIHMLDREFIARMGGDDAATALPFHRADKKVPTIDAEGKAVIPTEPNAVKFEMFVFDAIPHAHPTLVIETRREEEFSPVKSKTGIDSAESCRDDQLRQWTRWARAAGVEVPADESGLPPFLWEVSPTFADSAEAFAQSWSQLDPKPEIGEGTVLE